MREAGRQRDQNYHVDGDLIQREEVIKMISEVMRKTGNYLDLCRGLDAILKDLESSRG